MSTPIENNTAALHDLLEDVQNLPDAVLETEKGAPNGVATLGSDGKVPSSQLPAMNYVPTSRTVNGKALSANITLSASDVGARASAWTPSASDVGAIPATQKGAPNGVATLGGDGKVPSAQLPESGGVKSYYKQFSASDWSGGTMVIPAATHGLAGTEVLAQFSALVSGTYYPNTWSAMESYATVNATTKAVTLHSDSAYAGAVLLIG